MFAIYEQDGTKTHEVVTEGSKTIFGFNDSLLDGVINASNESGFSLWSWVIWVLK